MKLKLLVIAILFLVSSSVFCVPRNTNPYGSTDFHQPVIKRTFNSKISNFKKNENVNFKSALFSISKSSFGLNGLKANKPYYDLDFSGNIDIAPGGNKFWDLETNAEVIEDINYSKDDDSQTITNFKDSNYYKTVILSILGQDIKANEYYYIADDGLYAKGIYIAAQTVSGSSGITLTVPAQVVLYTPSKLVSYFPLTFDGTIHTVPQYNRTIYASVSGASTFGIPDGTPVSYSVMFNDTYKVLSWGGLQLIEHEKPVNALLVQIESRMVGTIYINGVKTPQEVLAPLKLTQDASESVTSYSFRNMTYPDNIAEFGLDGDKVTYLTTIKTFE